MFGFTNKKEKGAIEMPKKDYEGKEPDFYFGDGDKSFYIEYNGRFKNSIQTALINDYDDLDKFCQKLNLDGKDIEIKVRVREEYEGRTRFVKIIDVCTYTVPSRDTNLLPAIRRENDLRDNYELFREIQRDALKNNKQMKRQIIDYEDDEEEEEEEKGVLDKLGDRINELITPDVADNFMNMVLEKIFGGGETTAQPPQKQVSQNDYSIVNKIFKD